MGGIKLFLLIIELVLACELARRGKSVWILVFPFAFGWIPTGLNDYGPLDKYLQLTSFAEIAVVVCFIVSLKRKIGRSVLILLLLLYVALAIIGALLSDIADPVIAWRALRWNVILPLFAFYAAWTLCRTERDIDLCIKAFLLGTAVLGIVTIMALSGQFQQSDILMSAAIGDRDFRFWGNFQIPFLGTILMGGNITVFFHCMAIPFILSGFAKPNLRLLQRLYFFALFALNIFCIIISGSRTPILAVIISSAVVIFGVTQPQKRQKYFLALPIGRKVSLLTFALLLALSASGIFGTEISGRINGIFRIFIGGFSDELMNDSLLIRMVIWKEFIPTAIKAPLGAGFIESFAPIGGVDLGPHAQYLFLLLGSGIVGLLAWVSFLIGSAWICLKKSLRINALRWIQIGTAGAIISYIVNCFMIHTYNVRGADMVLFLLVGIGVRALKIGAISRKAYVNQAADGAAHSVNYIPGAPSYPVQR
jgi:hypothetical protein